MKKLLHPEVDEIDLKIIDILMQDAQTPYTEIAKTVSVSGGTIHVRMKKLLQLGIVTGSHLKINYNILGYDIKAYVIIHLEKATLYNNVLNELKTIPEILSIDYTTGNYSLLSRIVCKDKHHLQEIIQQKIQQISGIQSTETIISLQEELNRELKLT